MSIIYVSSANVTEDELAWRLKGEVERKPLTPIEAERRWLALAGWILELQPLEIQPDGIANAAGTARQSPQCR